MRVARANGKIIVFNKYIELLLMIPWLFDFCLKSLKKLLISRVKLSHKGILVSISLNPALFNMIFMD